jgi:large subunit ribosomal protein L23
MAFFQKKVAKKSSDAKADKVAGASIARDLSHVLRHARITEKASMHSQAGVYTFNISERATKRDIKQAVFALYKVTPERVRVLRVPTKVRRNARTGKTGVTTTAKKAYVYLKKGETINLS